MRRQKFELSIKPKEKVERSKSPIEQKSPVNMQGRSVTDQVLAKSKAYLRDELDGLLHSLTNQQSDEVVRFRQWAQKDFEKYQGLLQD
jgi:hypothetical protein